MLNTDRIRRMVAANSASEAAKILFECDYNAELITNFADRDDLIIDSERKRTVETFVDLMTNDVLKYIVLAKFDYHNGAAVYNWHKTSGSPDELKEAVYPFGNIELGKLRFAVTTKNYSALPDVMAQTLSDLDKLELSGQSPDMPKIDLEFNRALYADIMPRLKKLNNRGIEAYFRAELDILNIRTFAKLQLTGGTPTNEFIHGGRLTESDLAPMFSKTSAGIKNSLSMAGMDLIANTLAKGLDSGNLTEFENVANAYLVKIGVRDSDNLFKTNTLFAWYVAKIEELRIVKLILMGKKFGKSKDDLRAELAGLLPGGGVS